MRYNDTTADITKRRNNMTIRHLKIILIIFVGLQGWFYVAGNLANWSAALEFVAYVLAMVEHEFYPTHIFPPITNHALVILALLVIVAGEFLVGAFSFKGAWDLWQVRKADANEFDSAKTYAILGAGTAMIVWLGGFVVIGGGLFQMWQTQLGANSFNGAFVYGGTSALILLFVISSERHK
jgi:predicted small integral membrane protein